MNIFEDVKNLNLPLGKYLVLGGGVLTAHGLRDYHDIDILTNESIFEELSKDCSWKKYKLKSGKVLLKKGDIEVASNMWHEDYCPDTKSLLKNVDIINGIPFLQLNELLKFKMALGREKDLKDIELINQYINKK